MCIQTNIRTAGLYYYNYIRGSTEGRTAWDWLDYNTITFQKECPAEHHHFSIAKMTIIYGKLMDISSTA